MSEKLTHLDEQGRADMVDVGDKPDTDRMAIAEGAIYVQPATLQLIKDGNMKKGDVLTVARIAGIMGAKKTPELIPLCHPVPMTKIGVDLWLDEEHNAVRIKAQARTVGKTGIEMEVLTAVSITALTVYDMAKAVDRTMRIGDIRLLEKRGGMRGDYVAEDSKDAD